MVQKMIGQICQRIFGSVSQEGEIWNADPICVRKLVGAPFLR